MKLALGGRKAKIARWMTLKKLLVEVALLQAFAQTGVLSYVTGPGRVSSIISPEQGVHAP
jgi:ABC-type uncharacterized transport system auxiliary subunit